MGTLLPLNGPRALAFSGDPDPPLRPDEVRLGGLLCSTGAGTELARYRGASPDLSARWDADRMFVPDDTGVKYPVTNLRAEEVDVIVARGLELASGEGFVPAFGGAS